MPSGYIAGLPADVLLDAGLLKVGGSVIGVTRGGLSFTNEKEWRNVEFDGKRSPVMGLDRIVGCVARFGGTLIELSQANLRRLLGQSTSLGGSLLNDKGAPQLTVAEAAALSVAVAASLTSDALGVPEGAGVLLAANRYVPDLRLVFARGGGGTATVVFPLALCNKYDVKGQDKSEAEIGFEFEARLDLSASTDTDVLPYTIELAAP